MSGVIAGLSIVLAFGMLFDPPIMMVYYSLSTIVFTVVTYLLKRRLYFLLSLDKQETETSSAREGAPWKAMLLVLAVGLAALLVPLLFAEVLSAVFWFVMIVSFTSGISISEIILYFQSLR